VVERECARGREKSCCAIRGTVSALDQSLG
jgi:hypothetical protein